MQVGTMVRQSTDRFGRLAHVCGRPHVEERDRTVGVKSKAQRKIALKDSLVPNVSDGFRHFAE